MYCGQKKVCSSFSVNIFIWCGDDRIKKLHPNVSTKASDAYVDNNPNHSFSLTEVSQPFFLQQILK